MANESYNRVYKILKPYCRKDMRIAWTQTLITIVMLYGSIILNFFLFDFSLIASLVCSLATAVFMSRALALVHDCGHLSLHRTRLLNSVFGNILAFPTLITFRFWQYLHDSHHKHVGNLSKRFLNPEVWTLTLKEYQESSSFKKFLYRIYRSKFSRFVLNPTFIFGIAFRLPISKYDWKSNVSVVVYDILYILTFATLFQMFGFNKLSVVYFLPLMILYSLVTYVFYGQHQNEHTYWEKDDNWTFEDASFHGSTYMTAPTWFNWLTGNVVHHNIHHLMSGIPNYNLEKAYMAVRDELEFNPIPITSVPSMFRNKLWDEESKKLIPIP